jgi:hypothetical protein
MSSGGDFVPAGFMAAFQPRAWVTRWPRSRCWSRLRRGPALPSAVAEVRGRSHSSAGIGPAPASVALCRGRGAAGRPMLPGTEAIPGASWAGPGLVSRVAMMPAVAMPQTGASGMEAVAAGRAPHDGETSAILGVQPLVARRLTRPAREPTPSPSVRHGSLQTPKNPHVPRPASVEPHDRERSCGDAGSQQQAGLQDVLGREAPGSPGRVAGGRVPRQRRGGHCRRPERRTPG